MKKILALLLAAAMCLSMAACGSTAQPAAETSAEPTAAEEAAEAPVTTIEGQLQLGDAFPNFTVTLEDGTVFTLSEALKTHKAVMINIWATWCHFCCEEMPAMQQAYAGYTDDVAVVCLSAYDENEDITAFKQANDLDLLPMGYDSVGVTAAVEYEGFPTTIMIDRFGNYAFYMCAAVEDPTQFTHIWDYYISDDYTETSLLSQIPAPLYEGESPTDEELNAALCADGSVSFTYDHDDEYLWPFVTNADGVVNSNALTIDAVSELTAAVTAQAGDVFAFDYDANLDTLNEQLNISINGEAATPIYYTGEGTWIYQFADAGDYQIDLTYQETMSDSSTDAAGTIQISNVRLASGKDAEAILAAQPTYTTTLKGQDIDLELLAENAKQIEISCPGGNTIGDVIGGELECYIIPEETCSFRMLLGDGLNITHVMAMAATDGREYFPAAAMEADAQGYPFEVSLSSVEDGGNSYNAVVVYSDAFPTDVDDYQVKGYLLFRSEENVNSFLQTLFGDGSGNLKEGTSWTYADGTQPSTTAQAQLAQDDTLRYNIYIVDEKGEPVNGCMINICSDTNCCPQMLTDTNYYGFNGIDDAEYPYLIHVLKVPDGYTFDTSTAFTLNASGDTLTITVPHA